MKGKNQYKLEESWIKRFENECNGRCAILHLERCPLFENGECHFPETDMAKRLIISSKTWYEMTLEMEDDEE